MFNYVKLPPKNGGPIVNFDFAENEIFSEDTLTTTDVFEYLKQYGTNSDLLTNVTTADNVWKGVDDMDVTAIPLANCLRLGADDSPGKIVLKFANKISIVKLLCMGMDSTQGDKIIINDITKNIGSKRATPVTVEFSPTDTLIIETPAQIAAILSFDVQAVSEYDFIINNSFPKYGSNIVDTISNIYGDNYYIAISKFYCHDNENTMWKRFGTQVKALCRQYPKLEEAQEFFDGRKIDGLATSATLQTILESESENTLTYNGGEQTVDMFNPINTATARTSSKTQRDFINNRNDANKGKTKTQTRTTGANADGRTWETALKEGLQAKSPINEFIDAFAGLLLLPPWEVE